MPSKRFTFLRKTIDSIEILEMTQIAGDGGEVMFFASLWHNAYENWYVIHPLQEVSTRYTFKIKALFQQSIINKLNSIPPEIIRKPLVFWWFQGE